jgi:enoyl-CoA hydratase
LPRGHRAGLTGDPIPAERAYQLGFVNQLAEPGQSLDAALQLAARVRHPPVRVRKRGIAWSATFVI